MTIDWLGYFAVLTVAYVVPGPDFLLVLRWSTENRRDGLLALAGAQTGLSVHIVLAVTGVSFLVARAPAALTIIQILGAIYLCYLGVGLIIRRDSRDREAAAPATAFRNALGTNLLNPKAIVFVTGVLPQFATGTASLPVELAILGLVDVLFGIVVYVGVVIAGTRLSRPLRRDVIRRRWNCANGALLIMLGMGLGVANV
ncbi:LysE family translocator [Williamsia muralis]|uniref:LysE family translocator n=1 Tax=Williamsia marianensis TaxID=85044 RepID=A0ABU4EQA9_WILMA|nr:LysE family translocator [Williamsia muralis]MDV7132839.1 LysE family translocator [Williamsia muralis]